MSNTEDAEFVVCETLTAMVQHLRQVTATSPVNLGGHTSPKPVTLCGMQADWDTRIPVGCETCHTCKQIHSDLRTKNG